MNYLFSLAAFFQALGDGWLRQSQTGLATHCWRWAVALNPAQLAARESFRTLGHLALKEFAGDNPGSWLHQAPRREDWLAQALYGRSFDTSAAYETERLRLLELWDRTPRLELGGKSPQAFCVNPGA